jgi:hypothetical protein
VAVLTLFMLFSVHSFSIVLFLYNTLARLLSWRFAAPAYFLQKNKGTRPSLPSAFAILTTPAFADRELAFPRFSNVETADASLEPIHAFFLSQICPRQGPNLGCGGYNATS